ncbi:MAG: SDR family NAD(P)-dependent oxidoreductase [Ilumatobacteraceae bacterium]|nr:SDR family NAD(P)-dependent oxidoreductase [Ilumatobacteraceae bacterium]
MKLKGKVAVVTGSGGGIGDACARRFIDEGAHVVVTDISAEVVERVADSLGTVGPPSPRTPNFGGPSI